MFIVASSSFYAVDSNTTVSVVVSATTEQHSTTLTGGDFVAFRGPGNGVIQKRANFNACSEELAASRADRGRARGVVRLRDDGMVVPRVSTTSTLTRTPARRATAPSSARTTT